MWIGRIDRIVLMWGVGLLVAGCAGYDIGLERVDLETAHNLRTANVLSGGGVSSSSKITLRRHHLLEKAAEDPVGALADLRQVFVSGEGDLTEVAALAELSFMYARFLDEDDAPEVERLESHEVHEPVFESAAAREARKYYLASALYGGAFAVHYVAERDTLSPVDPSVRTVIDIYNYALGKAFGDDKGYVIPRDGVFPLPFGSIEVSFDETELRWGQRYLSEMLPVAEFKVKGLNNRYRRPGVGAALTARTRPDPDNQVPDLVDPDAWVAATILLRVEDSWTQLQGDKISGQLHLYKEIDGVKELINAAQQLPIEYEPSAAVAASLQQSGVWEIGNARFLGRSLEIGREDRLFSREPYRRGVIPVVMVHGTDSTPATWANTVNDLEADPFIRDRYTFWYFSYESGNPILYSGSILRGSLNHVHGALVDRAGSEKDPCLEQMIVMGHSQGGLITKLAAIDSGSHFWDAQFAVPYDEVKDEMKPSTRKLVESAGFFERPPFVKRVVFMSTPHGGSYLAAGDFVRNLAARVIQLPGELVAVGADAVTLNKYRAKGMQQDRVYTSIDNMSPGNDILQALHSISIEPPVKAHSIIALRAGEDRETGGDGVVKYRSAHIEGVESEIVVESSHSVQATPEAVEELRRILYLHAEENGCW